MFIAILWALGAASFIALLVVLRRRSWRAALAKHRASWGRFRDRPRDMSSIASYFRARAAVGTDRWLDDRTWTDLNMDDVFAVLDRTESALGQQLLYTRLRAAPLGGHPEAFEALATRLGVDQAARERVQPSLAGLGGATAYDLWWLAEPGSLDTRPWYVAFPILALAMAAGVALVPVWHAAVFLLIFGAMASLVLRGRSAAHLRVVAGAFRHVGPLLAAGRAIRPLAGAETAPILGTLDKDLGALARLRRIASWAGRDSTGAASGDLAALFFEYLNLLFGLDGNALFFGARELRARTPEYLRVIGAVGTVDAALGLASYRAGTAGWIRPVMRPAGGPVVLAGIRHPLLADAIPNSLTLNPPNGAIITGSNMSGKSTFLRTLGVTAVLAQTLNTCLADMYEAPAFVVRSCIGRADDPATGKSYYLVEVESVLDLVHASREAPRQLFLFDELFRGTNAVERIAAGESVLVELLAVQDDGQPRHVVVAATHDQELVDLLHGRYAAYHFTDAIDAGGLAFDYQLRPGPATTHNAIALLGQRGAPPDLVARASARAAELEQARGRS